MPPLTDLEGFTRHLIDAPEGHQIAAFESRPPNSDGTEETLVLVNGLGGNLLTWKHLLASFTSTHRIITWDYRGLYDSKFNEERAQAARRGEVDLSPDAHISDALLVLDTLEAGPATFIGWSMGVQISFSLALAHPDRVTRLVQICGAPGRVVATTALGSLGPRLIPPAMELFRIAAERAGGWLSRVASSSLAIRSAKTLGVIAPTADEELAQEVIRAYIALDFEVYNRILMALGAHSTLDDLPKIKVPTLIVAGTRDPMTPVRLSQEMAAALPDAQLEIFDGASHYLPIEFPDRLNGLVQGFLGAHP